MADSSNAAASQDRRKFLGMAALTGMTARSYPRRGRRLHPSINLRRPLPGARLSMSTQAICEWATPPHLGPPLGPLVAPKFDGNQRWIAELRTADALERHCRQGMAVGQRVPSIAHAAARV